MRDGGMSEAIKCFAQSGAIPALVCYLWQNNVTHRLQCIRSPCRLSNKLCDIHHVNNGNQSIRFVERHFHSHKRIDPFWQTIVNEITLLIYVSFISIFIANSTTKHIHTPTTRCGKNECIDSSWPDEIRVCRLLVLWKMCVWSLVLVFSVVFLQMAFRA